MGTGAVLKSVRSRCTLRGVRAWCIATAVVSLGLLAVSGRWSVGAHWVQRSGDNYFAMLDRGLVTTGWNGPSAFAPVPRKPGLTFTAERGWIDAVSLAWRPYHIAAKPGFAPTADHHGFAFPIWLIALPATISAAYAHGVVVGVRRGDRGGCGKCGYSRAGLAPDAPCPECGGTKGV